MVTLNNFLESLTVQQKAMFNELCVNGALSTQDPELQVRNIDATQIDLFRIALIEADRRGERKVHPGNLHGTDYIRI